MQADSMILVLQTKKALNAEADLVIPNWVLSLTPIKFIKISIFLVTLWEVFLSLKSQYL